MRLRNYWFYGIAIVCILALSITPCTAATCTFTGNVYLGFPEDTSHGLSGVKVSVYETQNLGSVNADNLKASTNTDNNGYYRLTFIYNDDDAAPIYYYQIVLTPPVGYENAGMRSAGGVTTAGTVNGVVIFYEGLSGVKDGNNFWLVQKVPPVASFTSNPTEGPVPLTVSFTDFSTGYPTSWSWNFGDGSAATGKTIASHQYIRPDTYTVTLTVENPYGSNTVSKTIKATPQNVLGVSGAVKNPANGHYYELVDDPGISWTEASFAASSQQISKEGSECREGHLATVTSQEENDFLVRSFGTENLMSKWLGGYQPPQFSNTLNEGWRWVTDEPWIYTNWNSGEPKNTNNAEFGYEDALAFWSNGKWNDVPRNYNQYSAGGYIIEYDCEEVAPVPVPNNPPVASFSFQVNEKSRIVSFDASASRDSDGTIKEYNWNFGDGLAGAGMKPSHTYNYEGTFYVTLTVTDNGGATDTTAKDVTMSKAEVAPHPVNQGIVNPIASFIGQPNDGESPLFVQFTDTSTGNPTSWSWEFGDGAFSSEHNPMHDYTAPGEYTVSLTVKNQVGEDTETVNRYIKVAGEKTSNDPISGGGGSGGGAGGGEPGYGWLPWAGAVIIGLILVGALAIRRSGGVNKEVRESDSIKDEKVPKVKLPKIDGKGYLEITIDPPFALENGGSTAYITVTMKDKFGYDIIPKKDTAIALSTDLGLITSPIIIPAESASGLSRITVGEKGGRAIISAHTDKLKGEGVIEFSDNSKK
jgi:PKD repeat protein